MRGRLHRSTLAIVTFVPAAPLLRAQDWPEIFGPHVLRTLDLKMSDQDWQTIRHDETLDIEVPRLLWLDGEQPILVSIRRKSADPLTAVPGFDKVSDKIDIHGLVSDQNRQGLRSRRPGHSAAPVVPPVPRGRGADTRLPAPSGTTNVLASPAAMNQASTSAYCPTPKVPGPLNHDTT